MFIHSPPWCSSTHSSQLINKLLKCLFIQPIPTFTLVAQSVMINSFSDAQPGCSSGSDTNNWRWGRGAPRGGCGGTPSRSAPEQNLEYATSKACCASREAWAKVVTSKRGMLCLGDTRLRNASLHSADRTVYRPCKEPQLQSCNCRTGSRRSRRDQQKAWCCLNISRTGTMLRERIKPATAEAGTHRNQLILAAREASQPHRASCSSLLLRPRSLRTASSSAVIGHTLKPKETVRRQELGFLLGCSPWPTPWAILASSALLLIYRCLQRPRMPTPPLSQHPSRLSAASNTAEELHVVTIYRQVPWSQMKCCDVSNVFTDDAASIGARLAMAVDYFFSICFCVRCSRSAGAVLAMSLKHLLAALSCSDHWVAGGPGGEEEWQVLPCRSPSLLAACSVRAICPAYRSILCGLSQPRLTPPPLFTAAELFLQAR